MNVLSLFDGMSCGHLALDRAGIHVDKYFASEIDKYAIKITQKNYPNTIQLGDINNWKSWDLPKVDMIIGGSPCQGFSIAGKGLNFDDPRSKLFFVFVDILKHYKPKWFLLENVRMKKEWQDVISDCLGIEPIKINSALVSAQNRVRLYWTNIPNITQPKDKGLVLADIIEFGEVDREKSYTIDANYFKGGNPRSYFEDGKRQLVFEHQSQKRAMVKVNKPIQLASIYNNNADAGRIYSIKGKARTLKGESRGMGGKMGLYFDDFVVRKLTPIECERLQTVPDDYTKVIDIKEYLLYNKEEINKKGNISCNAKLINVQEKQQPINTENSVFYITKDIKDMEALNYLKENIMQIKNVNIVIKKLGKKEVEQEECVIDITKIGLDTTTHSIQTKLEREKILGDIKKELTVKIDTGKYMKIILEENLKVAKSYIISILIKLIIELKIYFYVMDKANIQFYINNLSLLQDNLLKIELSNLKMESILYCSNTQRYKMLGNGWTVDVIAHIFSFIPN